MYIVQSNARKCILSFFLPLFISYCVSLYQSIAIFCRSEEFMINWSRNLLFLYIFFLSLSLSKPLPFTLSLSLLSLPPSLSPSTFLSLFLLLSLFFLSNGRFRPYSLISMHCKIIQEYKKWQQNLSWILERLIIDLQLHIIIILEFYCEFFKSQYALIM